MKPLLLSILPRPPHPTRDGLAIRNYHLLAALAAEFRVQALVLRAPHLPPGEYPDGIEWEEIGQAGRRVRRATGAVASLLSRQPYSPLLYRSARLTRATRARSSQKPEWVVAHSYHVGPLALATPGRCWIDFHNLDSQIWQRVAGTGPSSAARWFARFQAPRVRAFEADLAARADGLSCVSDADASSLGRLASNAKPVVVPNGVDLERYAFRGEPAEGKKIFFVGDLSWPPNADAIAWFESEVWPGIAREHPDARVEILGRDAPASLLARAADNFRFLGEGGDTRPHWRDAAVAVVPLRAGGGTRLKILEAAACGVPVVSTPIGAEGLALRPGQEIYLAEDASGFAQAVGVLLAEPRRGAQIARAARSRVESLYAWDAIGRRFSAELLARRG